MNKKYRILIVDDEPNNLQLMMQILSKDYQLAFAANGKKALEIAQKLETDLILLDIMMPDMDGYEVCRRLKADEKLRHIPIIFVTAKDEVDDETRGLKLGAIDYIAKPISPPIVKARVRNHLELKIAREKIERQNKQLEAQNRELLEADQLRDDVELITRHDLKTPLNGIIGFSRVIMNDENCPGEYMEYLKMLEESGLKMLNMINLSLDLFKMERGIYEFRPDSVDILQVIQKIPNELYNIARLKRLSTDIQLNEDAASNLIIAPEAENSEPAAATKNFLVWGEKLLCYSMLANLIKNAFEASPRDEKISITLTHEEKTIVISIHNKGAVSEDIRDKFFNKYVTSGRTTGTGLGTYSARLIAETQKGSIRMDTSEEEGTILTVLLPRAEVGMTWE